MGSCSASDGQHDPLLRISTVLAVAEILESPKTYIADRGSTLTSVMDDQGADRSTLPSHFGDLARWASAESRTHSTMRFSETL